jgi:hypothetical protein
MDLQPCEIEALDTAALLMKYAAESQKKLPNSIVLPISTAWEAREAGTWSPQIATDFWTAYSDLCDLIKPVSLDTISTNKPVLTYKRWWLFGPELQTSLSRRTAHRYLTSLICLLIFAVIFGFIVAAAKKLDSDIEELVKKGDAAVADVIADLNAIKADLEANNHAQDALQFSLDDASIPPDTKKKIAGLRARLQDLYYASDMLHEKAISIGWVTAFRRLLQYDKGDLSRLPKLEDGYANVQSYYNTRREVVSIDEFVFIVGAIYVALVPLLMGTIGAGTYVLRLTSEQIRDTSFSTTSPIRHIVRISLGALAGLTVGLGGIIASATLPAAALAFIAGYAVEPVFSTLDGIAEKFRRT